MSQKEKSIGIIKSNRLKFIDIARSLAILLMLQGHFITLTFKNYHSLLAELRENGSTSSLLFDWWVKIRGFTAPLFFTITGLVFVYLLVKSIRENSDLPFLKIDRIRKGIRRGISLIAIGYILQFNLKYISYYAHGNLNDQFYAFHILQSIGFGLLGLIFIYFLYFKIRKGKLALYYLVAGTLIFMIYPFVARMGKNDYFPAHAPQLIQNIIHGPKSNFPLVPWIGYVFFGGMLGTLLYYFQKFIVKKWFVPVCILFAVAIDIYGRTIGKLMDIAYDPRSSYFEGRTWVYDRLAEVILLITMLILIEKVIKIKDNLFLKIGRNTFPIYIVHVIILYGAVIGYSLKDLFRSKLSGIESFWGAVIFISIFALYIKFIEIIHQKVADAKKQILIRLVGESRILKIRTTYSRSLFYFYKKVNKNNETKK